MLTRSLFIGLLLTLLPQAPYAQEATEIFIPIGESPGVSNINSIIGKITAVDVQNRTVTLSDQAGTVTVSIPQNARIWLDRSKGTGKNEPGSPADLKAGRTLEVKYKEATRGTSVTAEWVKIEVTG